MPSKQNTTKINDFSDDDLYNNKNNIVIYKNNLFGLKNDKGLPKLNLFRTSQILSEFSELPKSLNGAPLDPMQFNNEIGNGKKFSALEFDNSEEVLYSARNCPPPPPGK